MRELEPISVPSEISEATSGLQNEFKNILLKMRIQENALTIFNYIISMKHEVNLSDNYRTSTLKALAKLSNFTNKEFSMITREDLLSFLNSLRKQELLDPLHRWIGTYNNYLVVISRFFKWFYYPSLPQKDQTEYFREYITIKKKRKKYL